MAGAYERNEESDFASNVAQTTAENIERDVAAARVALAERASAESFVTLGFCFGGTHCFYAGTDPALGLDAAIGFYGLLNPSRVSKGNRPSMVEHAAEIRVRVLGLFGGADENIPAEDIASFNEGLERAGVPRQIVTYPGAPHPFFDRRFEEYADASADAWRRLLDFLDRAGAPAA